jgi:hypothetical protein
MTDAGDCVISRRMGNPSRSDAGRNSWWRLPVLLAVVLATMLVWRGRGLLQSENVKRDLPPATAAKPSSEQVLLTLDFGDGEKKELIAVPWREGMTVADLMTNASNVSIRQRGSGQGALLISINDVSNQGADGKNWTYKVNDQDADRSFAVYELRPGDRVLWTFGLPR